MAYTWAKEESINAGSLVCGIGPGNTSSPCSSGCFRRYLGAWTGRLNVSDYPQKRATLSVNLVQMA